MTYTNWNGGEPNNFDAYGSAENCMVMYKPWGGIWHDVNCDDLGRTSKYICQIRINKCSGSDVCSLL